MEQDPIQQELNYLHDSIRKCRKCPLHRSRIHAVPGEGLPSATAVFIGEAPGKEEDLQGRPFVGHSGKFLDYLLNGIGFSREQAYITSAVKCRPPKNRIPHVCELKVCKLNWLDRQISLVDPQVVVLLGKTSLKQTLGEKGNLSSLHGQLFHRNRRSYFVTFHPAAAMRFPNIERQVRQDFKKLGLLLNNP